MRTRVRDDEHTGELNLVPYLDVVTNLVMFMLLSTVGLISLGVLDVGTPRIGTPDPATAAAASEAPPLNLTVGITDRGFYVSGAGAVIEGEAAREGVDPARPPTIPRKGADYDYAALSALLGKVKDRFPGESRVILVATNDTPYDLVIHTMDACREQKSTGAESRKLFPEVWLSTMR